MDKIYYIGLDVHKESIAIALAEKDGEVRAYGVVGGTLDALDKAIQKIQRADVQLHFVYEAGPCGYGIYWHLKKRGLVCGVAAPSLIPKKPGDRIKTDRRDAEQLARLYRAGELTLIYVPQAEDEAIRDLVRARFRAVCDQRRARQRVTGFLLRHGFRYAGKGHWTAAHLNYLSKLKMPYPAQQIAFQEYVEAVTVETERVERLRQAAQEALVGWQREPLVRALMSLRGIGVIHALTLVAEVGDLSRFDSAPELMSFFGLTACEHSSGATRHQGGITKAGNGACRRVMIEAAHQYRLAPRVGITLQTRQHGQSQAVRAIALKAQTRLNSRYRLLSGRRKKTVVVVTALARELCGFVWAIACQLNAPHKLKEPAAVAPPKTDPQKNPAPGSEATQKVTVTQSTRERIYVLKPDQTFTKKAPKSQDGSEGRSEKHRRQPKQTKPVRSHPAKRSESPRQTR